MSGSYEDKLFNIKCSQCKNGKKRVYGKKYRYCKVKKVMFPTGAKFKECKDYIKK